MFVWWGRFYFRIADIFKHLMKFLFFLLFWLEGALKDDGFGRLSWKLVFRLDRWNSLENKELLEIYEITNLSMNTKVELHFDVDDHTTNRFTNVVVYYDFFRCILNEIITNYFRFQNLFFPLQTIVIRGSENLAWRIAHLNAQVHHVRQIRVEMPQIGDYFVGGFFIKWKWRMGCLAHENWHKFVNLESSSFEVGEEDGAVSKGVCGQGV